MFAKKAIGGFGGPKGGWNGGGTIGICGGPLAGWSGGGEEEDDGSGWIRRIPLSLCGLWKWVSSKNLCALGENLNTHWNEDSRSKPSSLHQL